VPNLISVELIDVLIDFCVVKNREEEGAQHMGESAVPLNREELANHAVGGIAQRTREALERKARESEGFAVGKK
jgi:hypothetical protein